MMRARLVNDGASPEGDLCAGWLGTPQGQHLLREEARQLREALDSLFGDQFL